MYYLSEIGRWFSGNVEAIRTALMEIDKGCDKIDAG